MPILRYILLFIYSFQNQSTKQLSFQSKEIDNLLQSAQNLYLAFCRAFLRVFQIIENFAVFLLLLSVGLVHAQHDVVLTPVPPSDTSISQSRRLTLLPPSELTSSAASFWPSLAAFVRKANKQKTATQFVAIFFFLGGRKPGGFWLGGVA